MILVCFGGYDFGCMINDSCLCFSGYDFGYMIRILSGDSLAVEEADFFGLLRLYFQNIYDVKYLMKSCKNLKGGLQEVADQLEVSGCLNSAVCVPLEDKNLKGGLQEVADQLEVSGCLNSAVCVPLEDKNLKGGLQEVADQLEVSGCLNSAVCVPLEDKNLKGGLQEVADQLEVRGCLNSAVCVPLEDKMPLHELQGCQARLYSQPAAYTNLLPCSTVCVQKVRRRKTMHQ